MSDGKTAGTSVAEKVHRDRALLRFDRLRSLRGSRQYLFATRSPGIVVSGDAEQIVTMKATAGHGEVEAVGSLEHYELNAFALEHLEGGRIPFSRCTLKLKVSVDPPAT